MTIERPDGTRVLAYRDGSPVLEGDGRARPIQVHDLDPASRRIVQALLDASATAHRAHAGERVERDCPFCHATPHARHELDR